MKVEQKKSKLIEDLVYRNGELQGKLFSKNILIANRIIELYVIKDTINNARAIDLLDEEINWLKKLADI